jgi:hypothetical protein
VLGILLFWSLELICYLVLVIWNLIYFIMLKNILFIANSIVGEKPGLSGGEVRFLELAKVWQNTRFIFFRERAVNTFLKNFRLKVRFTQFLPQLICRG